MTAAGRFRCCQCCRDDGGLDFDYHTEYGADSHEIPCPTCDASPRLLAKVDALRAERDVLAARLAAVDEVIRIHDTTTDIAGGGRGLVPTDTLRAALATDTTKEN